MFKMEKQSCPTCFMILNKVKYKKTICENCNNLICRTCVFNSCQKDNLFCSKCKIEFSKKWLIRNLTLKIYNDYFKKNHNMNYNN